MIKLNKQTDFNVMDFGKAFDKVSHRHLIYLHECYGSRGSNTHVDRVFHFYKNPKGYPGWISLRRRWCTFVYPPPTHFAIPVGNIYMHCMYLQLRVIVYCLQTCQCYALCQVLCTAPFFIFQSGGVRWSIMPWCHGTVCCRTLLLW